MGKLVHGMNLLCFRPDKNKLLPKYALYLIRSKIFRNQLLRSIKKAVNQASVSTSDIKKIKVKIPPLEKQKYFTKLLDISNILEVKRINTIEKLDELEKSIFNDIFY